MWAKIDIKSSFFAQRAKKQASAEGRSTPQELEVGPCSGPHLLVFFKDGNKVYILRYNQDYIKSICQVQLVKPMKETYSLRFI